MTDQYHHRVRSLAEALRCAGIAPEVAERILQGGAELGPHPQPVALARWMQGAMQRLDAHLGLEERRGVRERCACCLGGKRQTITRSIAKQGGTLAERVAAANAQPYVFGHSVTLEDSGSILVRFGPAGPATFKCPCLKGLEGLISPSYCMCCGGHVKHHLQTALGLKLTVEVLGTVLSSGENCSFRLTPVEE